MIDSTQKVLRFADQLADSHNLELIVQEERDDATR